ncbi:recombinase family protein, partial [Staphylococcus hominis]|uniref:recombinase family protein n=1 Tax=Staphylococcus hominis TaxID=1290 RepID=UPI001643ADEA
MKYGYIRPVTINDDLNEQKKKIETYTKKIVEESHANNKKRNELNTLLNSKLVFGDTLYITDLCI